MALDIQEVKRYHCENCIALEADDHPEHTVYVCKHTNKVIDFNVETQKPCKGFHPEDYIRALNADSVERD